MDVEGELAEISLPGSWNDAGRVRALAKRHGAAVVPFLVRAAYEGAAPVMAAALQWLARLDPQTVAAWAFTLLPITTEHCDVRAAAAEVLAHIHTDAALEALLQATVDDPIVAGAATRALYAHRSPAATARIHAELRALVAKLGVASGDDARLVDRRFLAFPRLLYVMVRRSYAEVEPELFSWWRTFPVLSVRTQAARVLVDRSLQHAYLMLTEGIRDLDGDLPSGDDHALADTVRLLFSDAAYFILREEAPAEAFERLIPFFDARILATWVGALRASVILMLLVSQMGWNETSWMWGYSKELHERGVWPDARWRVLEARADVQRYLRDELRARLSGPR